MNRYTFNALAADVRIANRYLLDHPKPGCYFYTLGQSYGRTQLNASRIEPDGTVCQFDQIESGSPKDCRIGMFTRPLAGHCHPYGKINRHQAAGMLRVCSDMLDLDECYQLDQGDAETLASMARSIRYRNTTGRSMAFAFWASCKRAASKSRQTAIK